jgi:hypothetical protein
MMKIFRLDTGGVGRCLKGLAYTEPPAVGMAEAVINLQACVGVARQMVASITNQSRGTCRQALRLHGRNATGNAPVPA